MATVLKDIVVKDIRFPTSRDLDGSDAMNDAPDYSAAYVILKTDDPQGLEGHGLTFTIGRGNQVCVEAIHAHKHLLLGKTLESLTADMGAFWRMLTGDSQLRWIGPEKGAIHLATAALVNAVWDLYAKSEKKPLWKLLAEFSSEEIVRCIDFRYISDAISNAEALDLLQQNESTVKQRLLILEEQGYPAYTTSAGWLGYSEAKLRQLCQDALHAGWRQFKLKVGRDLAEDQRRCEIIREEIGWDCDLMLDANQVWDVDEAIENVKALAPFKPLWIEEPTSPDDVLGHAEVAKAVRPLGVGVATGEHCQNRVIFKQFLQASAIDFCQLDCCRLGGVNEVLGVLLMAKKFDIPVCPHAGGVGLCEYVQHLSIFDYLRVSASLENRRLEFVDHLHQHFLAPVQMRKGRYLLPQVPGFSIQMKPESLETFEFPKGSAWQQREKLKLSRRT